MYVERIKTSRGCVKCGENHPACLDLHHLDPATKVMSVAKMVDDSRPYEVIDAEITKCEVLCSNCHKKAHYAVTGRSQYRAIARQSQITRTA